MSPSNPPPQALGQAPLEPAIEAQLAALVASNPGQGSIEEYRAIWSVIAARCPCDLLVFGVGRDSALWLAANAGGRTVFIEHEAEWIAETRRRLPTATIAAVRYTTRARWWRWYLLRPARLWLRDLPPEVAERRWQVIFVDSPQGYRPSTPGRMMSIFSAARLAAPGADVLVHDTDRTIERRYGDRFFGEENLIGAARTLRCYRIPQAR
ncbi:MAG: hypothetical protein IPK80_29590 [Nannocystis sp.]|nr:hypothetical protein [Nannocystis sp.]